MRSRTAVLATSLTLLASLVAVPVAGAKGGGDINNTVSFSTITTTTTSGGGSGTSGGGGGGGGGKSTQCFIVSIDPITGVGTGVCTTNRV
jgi:hypothetical protein